MKKRRRKRLKESSFIQEYNYEIVVFMLLATGLFLLLEKMKIKRELLIFFQSVIVYMKNIIFFIFSIVENIVRSIEISDLVGIVFIFIALIMILRRIRARIFQRLSQLDECPKCGQDLHRSHRTMIQKLFGLILYAKVMHFACNKCDFQGLKLKNFK